MRLDKDGTSKHRLDFGDLDLSGQTEYEGARFIAMAEGATLGNPEPVDKSIVSALLDGSFVTTESHGNREPAFQVWIEAADSFALSAGERILFERCSQPIELGWTPPDGWGPKTIFHAFTSHLAHEFDDMLEVNQLCRSYMLRLVCSPFGFSELEVVDDAILSPDSATVVPISDGSSAAGWSVEPGPANPTVISSGGALLVSERASSGWAADGYQFARYEFSASRALAPVVDLRLTPYIYADVSTPNGSPVFGAAVNGVELAQVAATLLSIEEGVYRYRVTWRSRDAAAGVLRLTATSTTQTRDGLPAQVPTFVIDNVKRADQAPAGIHPGGRQSMRTLEITGSARTAGSVSIEHPETGLGDVLFYVSPELGKAYSPDQSRYVDVATTTVQNNVAASVSGQRFSASGETGVRFNIPADVLPAGAHLLMARVNTFFERTITWTAETVIGGQVIATESGTALSPAAPGDVFSHVELGMVTLPSAELPASSTAVIRITLNANGLQAEELWTFLMNKDSALTEIACGTGAPQPGTSHSRLFLDAPSITNGGRPGLFVGTLADRSDSYHGGALAVSWEVPRFKPPLMRAYVVTPSAPFPLVRFRHRPAWFTHAGPPKRRAA